MSGTTAMHLIFSQGDAADAMFYVEAGNVKLTKAVS
jgi:CRP-like cAMP-binding protein